jgi:flagellar basal body rod protein FlgC
MNAMRCSPRAGFIAFVFETKRDYCVDMPSVSSISLSGMNAAQTRLDSAAHNVANTETTPFRRQEVIQTEQKEGGVSTALSKSSTEGPALETDMVAQLQAKNAFLVNLQVFKTSNQMAGALLDQKA